VTDVEITQDDFIEQLLLQRAYRRYICTACCETWFITAADPADYTEEVIDDEDSDGLPCPYCGSGPCEPILSELKDEA
jgi:DNA-directed RNA polymerase subunit RPC12/RpoP